VVYLQKFDHLINLIEDGAWYSLKELSKQTNTPQSKLEDLSKLLSDSRIIEYNNKKNQVRLKKEWRNLLQNIFEKLKYEKATMGTIVLPPKKSVCIQGIQVTNLTDKELELSMRVNKKLEELALGAVD